MFLSNVSSSVLPRSIMNFFLETMQVLLLSIWYNVESFIHLFVPRKKKNIAGEVVLITGSGSGIGRLMAQEFAALGTVLVLWDINQEGMKETARLAKQSGASRVHYYLCDCSDRNEVYRVADQVKFPLHYLQLYFLAKYPVYYLLSTYL